MISSLFFLNDHGEVIIEMQYRGKIPRSTIEAYWARYVAPLRFLEEAPAVVTHGSIVFSHILRNRVFLLAAVRDEGSALLALEELDLVARVLTAYLREFSEDTLRENFSVVYQLLQEVLDYGYPLTTEIFALEELVPRPTFENKFRSMLETPAAGRAGRAATAGVGVRQAMGSRGSVPWRDPATQRTANEILFDVVESMDFIMDGDGRVQRASVHGAIEVICRLSGMPDVLLQLLNTNVLDDVGFHRCVRLNRFVSDRAISFVPPDGRFTLMRYTCVPDLLPAVPPPFYVTPQVTYSETAGRFNCMVGMRGGGPGAPASHSRDGGKDVQRLVVKLMLPPGTLSVSVHNCSMGSTTFERSRGLLTWAVGNLGSSSTSLGGEFTLDSAHASAARVSGSGRSKPERGRAKRTDPSAPTGSTATAMVSFSISNHSVSGLRVDTVQILNEIGRPYKGVKYSAQSGNFVVRVT